jgi:hypothetical protein
VDGSIADYRFVFGALNSENRNDDDPAGTGSTVRTSAEAGGGDDEV